ncbi:MAG TPA: hypothetical protein VF690_11850, partial [Hymenobacter sp.]
KSEPKSLFRCLFGLASAFLGNFSYFLSAFLNNFPCLLNYVAGSVYGIIGGRAEVGFAGFRYRLGAVGPHGRNFHGAIVALLYFGAWLFLLSKSRGADSTGGYK